MGLVDCQRRNPLRPGDWRWQRALGIVDGTQPPAGRRRDGGPGFGWIKRAVRLQRGLQQIVEDADHLLLQEQDPDVYWAHYLHTHHASSMRHSLQAYLLTRETFWDVGYALCQEPGVVEAYEALFFNVRDRLDHTVYIMTVLFKDSLAAALSAYDSQPVLWKLYGYCYGAEVLKAIMQYTVNPAQCVNADTVASCLQDDAISTMKMKAALAAKTIALNPETQIPLLENFSKFIEIERSTDTEGRAQLQLMENIAAALGSLPFAVQGDGRDKHGNPIKSDRGPLAEYDDLAVELRYDETIRVAVGEELPYSKKLKRVTIPAKGPKATEG